uniref:NADAR domain-containing protein n=1 Tax=Haemonchus contortus TaxID=6289 RepID=A0A7I4YBS6_HAECO|nr:Conserved hypothetical protein CHP02464 domain containing protein [Haemonchus contortus]
MFNRTKSKNFRVEVLAPSSRRKAWMAKHPNFRKRPRVTEPQFESRCPIFLEDDVVIVDNSMKPSTSARSVELTRFEPSTSTNPADNKRNRIYAPLSAISSRLSCEHPEQYRHTRNEDESGGIANRPSTGRHDVQMLPKSKEAGREVVFCSSGPDQRPTPSSSDGFSRKARDIVIRRDFQGPHVESPSSRKRPAKDDAGELSTKDAHVHKSETLTVIIPHRRAALSRQEPKPQPAKDMESSPIVEPQPAAATAVNQTPVPSDEVKAESSPLLTSLPSDDTTAKKQSNGLSKEKDGMQPISDDESDGESEEGELIDPPVLKSMVSEGNIIPYSLDTHAFSNHHVCRRLLIHEQKFSNAEQYYMWSKAKFCKDFSAANAILYLKDPKMIKQVDSQLKNVNQKEWMKFSWKVRMKAAMAKFKQNQRMRYQLFRTIGSTLVEADVHDTYWGIGLSIDDPNIADPSKWRGANVMGEVLMQVRDVLKEDPDYSNEVERAKQNLFGSQ